MFKVLRIWSPENAICRNLYEAEPAEDGEYSVPYSYVVWRFHGTVIFVPV